MRSPVAIIYRWVLGAKDRAQNVVMRSLDKLHIGTPRGTEASTPGNVTGVPAGCVAWPVDPATHDGAAFVAADCFLAHFDAKKKEAYLLDDADGTRHRGAKPLKLGTNLTVVGSKKRSGLGKVLRTAEYGGDGLYKNVFLPVTPDLIAHHVAPNQPDNSSMVSDPDGDSDRTGGLHYPFRVREWVRKFCSGATQVVKDKLFAPLLNMRLKNGDGTDAAGGATFARGEAALSDEAKGPLACANDGFHRLGVTGEATIHQGALDINVLYGPVSDNLYMPEEIIDVPWEPGTKGPFVKRVEKRPDLTAKHRNFCGKEVPGQIKWQTWDTFREYPPTIKEPDPKKPTPDPRYPAMLVPPETGIPPTTGTPYEIESPSRYGHPAPAIPDGEPALGGTSAPAAPSRPGDEYWMNRLGWTERDWNNFSNVCTHEFSLPVYESASRGTGDNPWPTKNNFRAGQLQFDAQGNIIARDANAGNGTVIDAPAWARPYHGLLSHSHTWRESQHARVAMAGKNGAGVTIDGRLGLGARYHTSPTIASGQEFRLGFDGTGGITEPDLHLYPKSQVAVDGLATGGAKFVIHEDVHITGAVTSDVTTFGGTGDVVGPASATDNAIARYDTTTGKLIQNSGVVIDDPSSSTIRIHTGAAAHILITPDTSLSSGTFDTTVDAGGTGSTTLNLGTVAANAVAIGRSGKNTAVGGTLSSGAHTITQPTLGSVVRTHQSTATNDDPGTTDRHDRTTATGDGTTVTLHTLTLATGKSYILSAKVLGVCTAADGEASIAVQESGGYHIRATVKNVGGTASIIGQTQDAQEDTNFATATVALDATGATIRVRVTSPNVGDGTSTYVWHMAECVMSNPVGS